MFDGLPGVIRTVVGYTGGPEGTNPTYQSVCGGDGHTEALRVDFDPRIITYDALLQKFFEQHDFASLRGTQYRSAIWVHNEGQRASAERAVAKLKEHGRRVKTQIEPAQEWHDAEEYHQNYIDKATGKHKIASGVS